MSKFRANMLLIRTSRHQKFQKFGLKKSITFLCIKKNLCLLLFAESEATTQSSIEKAKEDFDDTVNHIAIKTGLKPVHVIVFVICKL